MTSERDPMLEALFDRAKQDAIDDDFTDQVRSRIDGLRRRALVGWTAMGLALLVVLALMAGPLTSAASLVTGLLPEALVGVDDQLMAQILAPVNSIAGALGLGFLILRLAFKKIFS